MARKKRVAGRPGVPAPDSAPAVAPTAESQEPGARRVVLLLSAAIFLAPAIGVPNELMLQDTLKSIVVSFAALVAALVFFWHQRARPKPVAWHPVLWLPLVLMAYALGSMAWSHAYLAGVEAIRWFVFALLLWLGLNTLSRDDLPRLAWSIHAGAVVASLWTALQFWVDFRFFPQGPNPASTFVNRNFFAEFVVCTLPFGALLLARARSTATAVAVAVSSAFVMVAILMTGTRAALIALWLQLLLVLPLIAWRYRHLIGPGPWEGQRRWVVAAVLLGTVLGLGAIPAGNPRILQEERGATAIERGLNRTASIQPDDVSLNLRKVMWNATLRVIADRPITGVGAGAWEAEIPHYQGRGEQLETDYYVHNEVLQLLAEYGLAGAVFLAGLLGYLLLAARRTWVAAGEGGEEGPWRATALTSLLALLVVSNVGFPWRMASTGALFALGLAILAASDVRLGMAGHGGVKVSAWRPAWTPAALTATLACLGLAAFITQQAAESERKIVRASQIALAISASPQPNHPRWDRAKQRMLRLVSEGIEINPHYRKITPIVADELARWGDWANATWIWESVLSSRPSVVAILTNVARGYAAMNQPERAFEYLARAKAISPKAPSVLSIEVILLSRFRDAGEALRLAREAVDAGHYDQDLLHNAFLLAWRAGDTAFAERTMALRLKEFPAARVEALMQLGAFQLDVHRDEQAALRTWKKGISLVPPHARDAALQLVPQEYRARVAP
jgi:O-antigen ligase